MVQARHWAFTSISDEFHRWIFRDYAWDLTWHIIIQGPTYPRGELLDSYETKDRERVDRAILAWFGDCWEHVCAFSEREE